jgi:hypothetical protein
MAAEELWIDDDAENPPSGDAERAEPAEVLPDAGIAPGALGGFVTPAVVPAAAVAAASENAAADDAATDNPDDEPGGGAGTDARD